MISNAVRLIQTALQAAPPDLTPLVAAMQPADWADFAALVEYHEVAPLIWASLRSYQRYLSPAYALHWKERYYLTAVRNDARLSELHAICRDLAGQDIRPIVLKGMALAPTVYASIALRAMGDTDLLVRRRDVAVAWAVLSARGYLVPPASARYWHLQFRNAGELRLIQRHTKAMVELHWWLCAG
ncbi:MAG: nucleotidyltransferase family protein, partial [Herpetosiphonaceae bacterium]|nr:nucleotidyltransferase family protein [Herpetosiphonaceae bacterium]